MPEQDLHPGIFTTSSEQGGRTRPSTLIGGPGGDDLDGGAGKDLIVGALA